MGAWGYRTFEDDTACDWLGAFQQKPSQTLIESSLEAVLRAGFVDDLVGPHALAAAQVVAALNEKPVAELDSEVIAWASSQPRASEKLLAKARAAVSRVFQESELRDIWLDAGNLEAWATAIEELQVRLATGSS